MINWQVLRRPVVVAVITIAVLVAIVLAVAARARSGPAATPPAASTPNSASSAHPAATSTPRATVPPPSPGAARTPGTGATVPVEPAKTNEAVPLDKTGDFGTKMTMRLSRITGVDGKATAPGEVAGPALRLTVVASNGSARKVDLNGVGVFLAFGADRTPASALKDGASPLRGEVASHATKTGTYVFTVPEDERDAIRVEINYSHAAPTVVFEGSAGR